jgi:FKBP-type peptidyl-prolyl cis-trans isomerase
MRQKLQTGKVRMRSWKRWAGGLAVLAMFGCGDGDTGAGAAFEPSIENREMAPAVDLSAMTGTGTGLYLMDLAEGRGEEAVPGKNVTVHYIGWYLDGEKFDASVDRGEVFQFPLGAGRVIAGWDQGVAGMRVGGKRRLVIPPELGYGVEGGRSIRPNSTLVFDVELFQVGEG